MGSAKGLLLSDLTRCLRSPKEIASTKTKASNNRP